MQSVEQEASKKQLVRPSETSMDLYMLTRCHMLSIFAALEDSVYAV
jgi:hypothetical protein